MTIYFVSRLAQEERSHSILLMEINVYHATLLVNHVKQPKLTVYLVSQALTYKELPVYQVVAKDIMLMIQI